jgi:hypothetical protein
MLCVAFAICEVYIYIVGINFLSFFLASIFFVSSSRLSSKGQCGRSSLLLLLLLSLSQSLYTTTERDGEERKISFKTPVMMQSIVICG